MGRAASAALSAARCNPRRARVLARDRVGSHGGGVLGRERILTASAFGNDLV